ncbi:CehA/McbA family metallohydrolase [Kribbella sp. NPDC050124]|uniref:CehA/McbA family metallohydrolase n=1 Tax=Kribbella sp. NPDC050124 TaxID=3364114 RepID=UPI0037A388B1
MCCEEDSVPPPVAEMLARYRSLMAERGFDWGDDFEGARKAMLKVVGHCDPARIQAAFFSLEVVADPIGFLVRSLPDPLPPHVAVVHAGDVRLPRPLPFVLLGRPITYQIVRVGDVSGLGWIDEAVVTAENPFLRIDGHYVRAAESTRSGRLHLVGDDVSRWTVVDGRGGSWFPNGVLHKFGWQGKPFFHGKQATLEVPAGGARVVVARGCEFRPVSVNIQIEPGAEVTVELSPERLYDAAERGWYGADLHVHMNYFGDDVATPRDAAAMQRGEGLHLMNLVAGNALTSLIYDQEAFEHFVGHDLPWSHSHTVARWGVEYRNDLFGHFHALNPSAPPRRYQTGHVRSSNPQDWPPNSEAAAELRNLGATVGYTHPVQVPLDDAGTLAEVFSEERMVRSCDARELVADAALGFVDSVDVGTNGDLEGTEYLYHRLLGCGLRLAASAGTDVMMQLSRMWPLSNPPGWFRAYADLRGAQLSVDGWQDAVRACRTFITNGPWLELDVAGHGLGETLRLNAPQTVQVGARTVGLGVERLEIVSPDGVMAFLDVASGTETAELTAGIEIAEPTWIAAVARGPEHPAVPGPKVYAHTSPVWVNVHDRTVARPADAQWCLRWLDRFEALARKHGNFTAAGQLEDLIDILDKARGFYQDIVDKYGGTVR